MAAATETLEVDQGATYVLHMQWLDEQHDGTETPHSLVGATIRARFAPDFGDAAAVQVDGTTPLVGTIVLGEDPGTVGPPNPANGWIALTLTPATTGTFTTTQRCVIDALQGGTVTRLLRAKVVAVVGIGAP